MQKLLQETATEKCKYAFALLIFILLVSPTDPGSKSTVPGQSATQLADGRWLLVGGESIEGSPASATIYDARTGVTQALQERLHEPRAWHSATLLPNGTVFIFGGVTTKGRVLDTAELFNPDKLSFRQLQAVNFTPRFHHSATLLTDGTVLIVGGISNNQETLSTAEKWDPKQNANRSVAATLSRATSGHTAILQSDGSVLLSAGKDQYGKTINFSEVYDPTSDKFIPSAVSQRRELLLSLPKLAASLPADGAIDVPLDTTVSLRFSQRLRMDTVNQGSVKLISPESLIEAKVIPAEGGMLAFITPKHLLRPWTRYKLSLDGPKDHKNRSLSISISFTTTGMELQRQGQDPEEWIPNVSKWHSDRINSPWKSLPALRAAKGVTALAGQALKLNGEPLANVTLQIANIIARTDVTGRFLIFPITAGKQMLRIDGQSASNSGKAYGIFHTDVQIVEGKTNILPFTIWMPSLDIQHGINIAYPTHSGLITNPKIPGLKVHIPRGVRIRDMKGTPVTSLSVTPVPLDRPPIPLPSDVHISVLFTMQPGGFVLEGMNGKKGPGIKVVYPNYSSAPAGTRFDLWAHDHSGWVVYGQGTVSNDGTTVLPDPDAVIREIACLTALGHPSTAPPSWPPPCVSGDDACDGDPVDSSTGLFINHNTDLFLPDTIPIALTRTYRQNDNATRPFGIGTRHPYDIFLVGDQTGYTYAELILPDGGRIRYNRISGGTGYTNAVMEHIVTPSIFYKSVLSWNLVRWGWDIKLRDGSVYEFLTPLLSIAKLSAIQDRNGNRLNISFDSSYRVSQITSPNGRWLKLTYDASNRITQVQDNINRSTNYTYDVSGRLWKVTDVKGGVAEYTYDASNRMLTVKTPRGFLDVTNEYDANGRVIKQTRVDNTTYLFAYTLDGNGKVIQTDITNPRGYIRRVTFNSSGYVLTDTRAVGTSLQQTTTYERQTGTNFVLSVTDELGRRTSYTYDAFGNMTSFTRLSGTAGSVTTTLAYEPIFNQLSSITDSLNHTVDFGYDTKGNLITITDPLNNVTNVNYSSAGQPTDVTDPLTNTSQFTYTSGDLTSITNPLGNSVMQFTDSGGRLLSRTGSLGHTARYEYDASNHLTKATDPLGGSVSFSYDPNGNLLSVTDARNNVTSFTYNNMDRLQVHTNPLLLTENYLYDNNGNLRQLTDRKNQVTSYTYDALDRLTQVLYHDGSTINYSYDSANRMTNVVDSLNGSITLTYDDLDRLTTQTTPQGSISYTYDSAGRRTSMTVAGQPIVNYTYDNANRLIQVVRGSYTANISYDTVGRRTSLTLPNGIVLLYGYNAASEITSITYQRGGNVIGDLIYEYDKAGQRTRITGSYARTGLPQPLSSANYNAENQQVSFSGQSLSYDNNGNLISDGTFTYGWNSRNQLVNFSGPGYTANFQYDAFGRRTGKIVNGNTTNYLYDAANAVQELSGTTPTANLLNGLGVDEYYTRIDSSGAQSILTDALGNTIALADSTGIVQTQYTYEPFGKTNSSGGGSSNSFQFTGRENDGTGLYYYRARYYNPTFQRFISRDPLGFGGGDVNLYSYVLNNPTNFADPSGQFPVVVFVIALASFLILDENVANAPGPYSQIESVDPHASVAADAAFMIILGPLLEKINLLRKVPTGACLPAKLELNLSKEALRRMAERGITLDMIEAALRKGQMFWDPKNKTVNFVIQGGFAKNGKDLLIGVNPVTGRITTVLRGDSLVAPRLVPLQ